MGERIDNSEEIINYISSSIKFNHNKTEYLHSNQIIAKEVNILGHSMTKIGLIGPFKHRLIKSLQKA